MVTMVGKCIASCEQFYSKLKLIFSCLQASLNRNKTGKIVWSRFDEYRKGRNSESLLW